MRFLLILLAALSSPSFAANIGDSTLPEDFLEGYFRAIGSISCAKAEYVEYKVSGATQVGARCFRVIIKNGAYKYWSRPITDGDPQVAMKLSSSFPLCQIAANGNAAQIIANQSVGKMFINSTGPGLSNSPNKLRLCDAFSDVFRIYDQNCQGHMLLWHPVSWMTKNQYGKNGNESSPKYFHQWLAWSDKKYYKEYIAPVVKGLVSSAKEIGPKTWLCRIANKDVDPSESLWIVVKQLNIFPGYLITEWRWGASEAAADHDPINSVTFDYAVIPNQKDGQIVPIVAKATAASYKGGPLFELKKIETDKTVLDEDLEIDPTEAKAIFDLTTRMTVER